LKRVEHVLDRLKKSTQAGDGSWGDKKTLQVRMLLHTPSNMVLLGFAQCPGRGVSHWCHTACVLFRNRVSAARASIWAIVARACNHVSLLHVPLIWAIVARACIIPCMTVVVRQGVEDAMLRRNAHKVAESKRTAPDAARAAASPS
jgi:hypothetical protein